MHVLFAHSWLELSVVFDLEEMNLRFGNCSEVTLSYIYTDKNSILAKRLILYYLLSFLHAFLWWLWGMMANILQGGLQCVRLHF